VVTGLLLENFDDIFDVKYTAHMEEELDQIEARKVGREQTATEPALANPSPRTMWWTPSSWTSTTRSKGSKQVVGCRWLVVSLADGALRAYWWVRLSHFQLLPG